MTDPTPPETMRVHRRLALAGVASRRAAERLVAEGRVSVNGRVASVGQQVGPHDRIAVDGEAIESAEDLRAYLLHKRAGVVSTAHDPQGRPTVLDDLPRGGGLCPVGRLDFDATGAVRTTNDGELAARLMRPRHTVPKTYEVLMRGHVSAATIRKLRDGVQLDDGMTLPARVEAMERRYPGASWVTIELTEGRNRQVKRMAEAVGHRVMRLHRARYAGLSVRGMQPGKWRPLTRAEWRRLGEMVGVKR